MRNKIVIFLVAIAVLAALFWWSGRQDRTGEAVPSIADMAETVPPAEHGQPAPTGAERPTVATARIAIQGEKGEDLGEVTVKPDQIIPVAGTTYSIRMTEFYTYWNWDAGAINISREEQNPAAKIEVLQDGKVLYYGWAFRNMKFFRMQMHGGQSGGESRLAFTLVAYDGLRWSSGGGDTGEKG